jgi:myo-inositol-1(or 4)-monophosphatase
VNYYRGTRNWAISIAHFDGSALTDGVIHAPDLGLTAQASRGQGCLLNGRKIVFDDALADVPVVALGHSPRAALPSYFRQIAALQDNGIEHRHYGAATICFLGVLSGWFDAFHEPALHVWDAAAGLLLVEEAGGTVRHAPFDEFLGGPCTVTATNRALGGRAEIWV